MRSLNSFNTQKQITIDDKVYHYFDLNVLANTYGFDLIKIPNSIKILLENLIRNEDEESVSKEMISNLCQNDSAKWEAVIARSKQALQHRINLWTGIHSSLTLTPTL